MASTAQPIPLLLASIVSVTLLAAAAEPSFKLPPETARLKPGVNLELVNANCVLCHSADYISTQPRLTAAQWRASVLKMQGKYGAPVATNNVDALVNYLVKNYGAAATTNVSPPRK